MELPSGQQIETRPEDHLVGYQASQMEPHNLGINAPPQSLSGYQAPGQTRGTLVAGQSTDFPLLSYYPIYQEPLQQGYGQYESSHNAGMSYASAPFPSNVVSGQEHHAQLHQQWAAFGPAIPHTTQPRVFGEGQPTFSAPMDYQIPGDQLHRPNLTFDPCDVRFQHHRPNLTFDPRDVRFQHHQNNHHANHQWQHPLPNQYGGQQRYPVQQHDPLRQLYLTGQHYPNQAYIPAPQHCLQPVYYSMQQHHKLSGPSGSSKKRNKRGGHKAKSKSKKGPSNHVFDEVARPEAKNEQQPHISRSAHYQPTNTGGLVPDQPIDMPAQQTFRSMQPLGASTLTSEVDTHRGGNLSAAKNTSHRGASETHQDSKAKGRGIGRARANAIAPPPRSLDQIATITYTDFTEKPSQRQRGRVNRASAVAKEEAAMVVLGKAQAAGNMAENTANAAATKTQGTGNVTGPAAQDAKQTDDKKIVETTSMMKNLELKIAHYGDVHEQ